MVVLWPRVVRGGWKRTYERLSPAEQRQVMMVRGAAMGATCQLPPGPDPTGDMLSGCAPTAWMNARTHTYTHTTHT